MANSTTSEKPVRPLDEADRYAEFPGVEEAEVIRDLSHEAQTEILDQDPNLYYYAARPGDVARFEKLGYRRNPPLYRGKRAHFRGHVSEDELVILACKREVWEKRQARKKELREERYETFAERQSGEMKAGLGRKARAGMNLKTSRAQTLRGEEEN